MRADLNKHDMIIVLCEYRSIVASDIDTAAIGEYPIDRMIIEK